MSRDQRAGRCSANGSCFLAGAYTEKATDDATVGHTVDESAQSVKVCSSLAVFLSGFHFFIKDDGNGNDHDRDCWVSGQRNSFARASPTSSLRKHPIN